MAQPRQDTRFDYYDPRRWAAWYPSRQGNVTGGAVAPPAAPPGNLANDQQFVLVDEPAPRGAGGAPAWAAGRSAAQLPWRTGGAMAPPDARDPDPRARRTRRAMLEGERSRNNVSLADFAKLLELGNPHALRFAAAGAPEISDSFARAVGRGDPATLAFVAAHEQPAEVGMDIPELRRRLGLA